MSFGVVLVAIIFIGLIIYNTNKSNKSYQPQSKQNPSPRRVTVDYLDNNKGINQNSSYSYNDSFSKNQKLAIIASLEMISSVGSDNINTPKRNAQKAMISKKMVIDFGINKQDWDYYSKNLTPSSVQNTMHSLTPMGKRFFFAYVFELLGQGGIPSHKEIMVAENLCDKVVGISNELFEKFMEETDNMLDAFS